MPQSSSSTQRRILQAVRSADEPVLTAAEIAQEAELTKRTVNQHVDDLLNQGRLARKPAGQAYVYYLSDTETRPRQHTCTRCGAAIYRDNAFATVHLTTYDGQPHDPTDPPSQFVLCRLCQNDVVNAITGNDSSIGDYPRIHSWNIPRDRLEALRDDDSVTTKPDDQLLTDFQELVVSVIRRFDTGTGVDAPELVELLTDDDPDLTADLDSLDTDDVDEDRIREAIQTLAGRGHLYWAEDGWRTAK